MACIEVNAKERKVWLFLVYMIRSCVLPAKEFQQIPLEDIDFCCDRFYFFYNQLFGSVNCTYNTHVVGSHLLEMRFHEPLPTTATFPFESFYGDIRNAFVPGTQAPLKQIFQKILAKQVLESHCCQSSIYYSERDTSLESNSLVYTYNNLQYEMYKIVKVEKKTLKCHKIHIIPAIFSEIPKTIKWDLIGVFKEASDVAESCVVTEIDKKKSPEKLFE